VDFTDSEIARMIEQANNIVSEVKEPPWYVGWISCGHLLSMIADISAVFKINLEADALHEVVNVANGNGMAKYRFAVRLMRPKLLIFNGVVFPEAAKKRTNALGYAYIELCKVVKRGTFDTKEIAIGKGIRLLKSEFKRYLRSYE